MLTLRLTVDHGLDEAQLTLAELSGRLSAVGRAVQRQVVQLFGAMEQEWFDSEGHAFGRAGWAPLAPSTVERKLRAGRPPFILQDTFALIDAATAPSSHARPSVFGASVIELAIGDDVQAPYAIFHQLGTARMPAREVVPDPVPDSFLDAVQSVVVDYLMHHR